MEALEPDLGLVGLLLFLFNKDFALSPEKIR